MLRKILSITLNILMIGMVILPVSAPRAAQAPAAPQALLQFTGGGHILGFSAEGMYAASGSHALHVGFAGANRVQPQADTPASSDGKAAPLSRVTYADLWDGITLAYTATPGAIYTTTYTLAPGAKPGDIRLRYNAPLALNADGTLSIAFETGTLTETAPLAWQDMDGKRVDVEAAFQVKGQEVAFSLGAYDPRYPLTIDPSLMWNILLWNTFLGKSGEDFGNAITVDDSGNVYVAGESQTTWGSPVHAFAAYVDTFVAKLNPSGSLLWNTFLGGSGGDYGNAIAVGGNGCVYVAGHSEATWGSPKRGYASGFDVFVAKLNTSGVLQWNTFLGDSGEDEGFGIAVDGSGNIHVTGYSSYSWGSPVRAYTPSGIDAFVAKLNSSGVLQWNIFLGGTDWDSGYGIAVDGSGNIYVTGDSAGSWGIPKRAYTGSYDAFVVKLSSSGAFLWNTFLGGSDWDEGHGIAVDGSGNAYVTGYSDGDWGSPVRPYTAYDAFAAKLNSSGILSWNTFLGGSGEDMGNAIAVAGSGNIYVAGRSEVSWGTPTRSFTGGYDAFAVKLNSSGSLKWNAFLGGTDGDWGSGIAVNSSGSVCVSGVSHNSWGSPKRAYTSHSDAFVAKLVEKKTASYLSQGADDGWILESSETSGKGGTLSSTSTLFYLGDNAQKKQYRAILSFDTATLPDTAVFTQIMLKLKLQGTIGASPFTTHGNLLVDVRKGAFGGYNALQQGDFQATSTKDAIGSFPKTPVGGWYTKNFSSAAFLYINKAGVTQFRLRFAKDDDNDAVADYLKFYSGNAGAAYQPQLIVEYYVP